MPGGVDGYCTIIWAIYSRLSQDNPTASWMLHSAKVRLGIGCQNAIPTLYNLEPTTRYTSKGSTSAAWTPGAYACGLQYSLLLYSVVVVDRLLVSRRIKCRKLCIGVCWIHIRCAYAYSMRDILLGTDVTQEKHIDQGCLRLLLNSGESYMTPYMLFLDLWY